MNRFVWQLNRSNLFWLLISVSSLLLLHLGHLPVWVSGFQVGAMIWRIFHYRGKVPFPGKVVKVFFVLASCAGLLLQYKSPIGLEPMLSLLTVGYALKMLEMNSRRDLLLLIYLGYFSAATGCIFSQEIPVFLAVLAVMILYTATLNAISQSRAQNFSLRPLQKAGLLLLVSLPLMVLLFMVMPRMGAMWSLPGPKNQATTGISDTLSPGDFTRLGRSAKVAFRVDFAGQTPAPEKLYWRGLVLSQFDGRSWSQSSYFGSHSPLLEGDFENPRIVRRLGEPLSYRITMEPSYERWVFALPMASSTDEDLILTRDFRLVSAPEIYSRRAFQITSWLDYQLDPAGLNYYREQQETALPSDFNPRTVSIARQWAAETPDAQQLINRVLRLFNESFVYTLQPPELGKHSVDEFLWQTQQGFCEHFASSFAFFMRAAGYPARVIAGYQGGEKHPSEGFITVRQYDAHAWTEVWLEDEGWVRIDPTAAVAPQRIRDGFAEMFAEEDEFLADTPLSLLRFQNLGLVNWLRLKLDYLDYAWATWVLGYDQLQYDLLARLLGEVTPLRIALFLLVGAAVTLLPMFLLAWRAQSDKPVTNNLDRIFLALCRKGKRVGIERRTGEGPLHYIQRLEKHFPRQAEQLVKFAETYLRLRFSGDPQASRDEVKELRQVQSSLRLAN